MYKKLIDQYKLYNFFYYKLIACKFTLHHKQENSISEKVQCFWELLQKVFYLAKYFSVNSILSEHPELFRSEKEIYCLSLMFSRELLVLVFQKRLLERFKCVVVLATSNLLCFPVSVSFLKKKYIIPRELQTTQYFSMSSNDCHIKMYH